MVALAAQPKGATFWMGARDHEKAYASADERRYATRIDRPYAICAKETTVAQMERYCGEVLRGVDGFAEGYRRRHDPDRKKADQTRQNDAEQQAEPAGFVPLLHALDYCNWLSRQNGVPRDQWCYDQEALDRHRAEYATATEEVLDIALKADVAKTGYRLPTEVEWEYACRSGASSSRFFGDALELLGSYTHHRNNSPANTLSPVGRHMPNAWGLFDTLGNVAEWCAPVPAADGKHGPQSVVRGGSLNDEAVVVRSSYRILVPVNAAQRDIGFRVARTLHGE
jgi:formylglycine-generating enzyme required for sulfatase activity